MDSDVQMGDYDHENLSEDEVSSSGDSLPPLPRDNDLDSIGSNYSPPPTSSSEEEEKKKLDNQHKIHKQGQSRACPPSSKFSSNYGSRSPQKRGQVDVVNDHHRPFKRIKQEQLSDHDENPIKAEPSPTGDSLPSLPRGHDLDSIASNCSLSSSSSSSTDEEDEVRRVLPQASSPSSKRSNSASRSPRRRGAVNTAYSHDRPFKRINGPPNREYTDILNQDIQDAALRFVPEENLPSLPSSLIGHTLWRDIEKELFFEALSRLSSRDIPGIAARIPTKTEFEVTQYLKLLRSSKSERHQPTNPPDLEPIIPADLPAAVELSQACCIALEEAADALSLRQEKYEDSLEKSRWGDEGWLITQDNYRVIEKQEKHAPEQPPPRSTKKLKSVPLFRLRNWLVLSERVFMNASFAENNWTSISADEPAIRATTLDDFYSLVVSLTKRLVAASTYVSESRDREKDKDAQSSCVVWPEDVRAAATSLGLPLDSRKFWALSARRLRLDVYDDDLSAINENGTLEPLSYSAVEKALGLPEEEIILDEDDDDALGGLEHMKIASSQSPEPAPSCPPNGSHNRNHQSDDEAHSTSADSDPPPPPNSTITISAAEKKREQKEVAGELAQFVTSCPFVIPKNIKRVMRRRIRASRAQEAYAHELDVRASRVEEQRMWRVLGRGGGGGGGGGGGVNGKVEEMEKLLAPKRSRDTVEGLYDYWCGEGGDDGDYEGGEGSDWGDGDDSGGEWKIKEEDGEKEKSFVGEEAEDDDQEDEDEDERGRNRKSDLSDWGDQEER